MNATPVLPFTSVDKRFNQRSSAIYFAMANRFAERKSKKGRITQVGREIPFSLDQFREWLILKLGGENGVVKCPYCAEWLSIDTLAVDHVIPASQGGSLDLGNLDTICGRDNQQKGGMCGECYQRLLDWTAVPTAVAGGLHPACRGNMLHRMQVAVSLGAWQRREMARNAKKEARKPSPTRVPVEDSTPF